MSEENLEALRRAGAAAKKTDPSILDALLDPEVVWEVGSASAVFDLVGTYRGIDEVRGYFARFVQAFAEWDWEQYDLDGRRRSRHRTAAYPRTRTPHRN